MSTYLDANGAMNIEAQGVVPVRLGQNATNLGGALGVPECNLDANTYLGGSGPATCAELSSEQCEVADKFVHVHSLFQFL